MEIQHRIGINGNTDKLFLLGIERLEIQYKETPLPGLPRGAIYFEINESDPRWPQIVELKKEFGASDIYYTIFTKKEILAAKWSRLVPIFEQGYPQPEDTWLRDFPIYLNHCKECGTFESQTGSFTIKKEPKLGKNKFMSLYWTYVLFSAYSVIERFNSQAFQGFEVWDVNVKKPNNPSKLIKQILIATLAKAKFVPDPSHKSQLCPACGHIKYYPHQRGYMLFDQEFDDSGSDFLLSADWFGDGHAAYREILVSNRVVEMILENNWRGVQFKPVKIL